MWRALNLSFATLCAVAIVHCQPLSAATFVASPTGEDSLPAALEKARASLAAKPGEARIILQGGAYALAAPITLTPADSGLTLEAAPGQKPVLSGGRPIAGWQPVPGKPNLWQAPVAPGWSFHQLFINDQRRIRARTPNHGFFRIDGPSPQDKPVKLKFHGQEIKKEWAALGNVELVAYLAWADIRMFIRQVDETNRIATLSTDPRPSNKEANARYIIENAPDALDAPGEWYLDEQKGIVSYIAHPGEDLSKATVIAPFLEDLLLIQGEIATQRPVTNITLRGLSFAHTDWRNPENGYADTQAAISIRGDIRAEAATDILIEDCAFSHLGGYALEFGRGCKRFKVIGNEISDIGAGGIRLGETTKRAELFEQNHGHVISDNHIHHLGQVFPPAVGVFILQSGSNRVAHNHIHHLYYTAVSVGWNWGYQETPCKDNIIEFNHMHDIGQKMLSDMGAVYTLGIQRGTAVRNNVIHDVDAFTYGGWGLYPDEGSSYTLWENNLVYRCKNAGFHQHYGRENTVRNNIFAFNLENQIMRTREEDHISFFLTNNIVYFDSGNLLGSNWSNNKYVIDSNIYFDARLAGKLAELRFAGATFDQWRARGHDTNSLVADPKFKAPRELNFELEDDSPAFKLGFKKFDFKKAGVRPKLSRPNQ